MDENVGQPIDQPHQMKDVSEQLKAARVAAGLSLDQVATETRVPLRHLIAIESGQLSSLPGKTYAMGFVRAYARTVGLDEVAMANAARDEYSFTAHESSPQYEAYEPVDPARVPPRSLAFVGLITALLLGGAYAAWKSGALDFATPEANQAGESLEEDAASGDDAQDEGATPDAAAPTIAADAPVTVKATGEVWLRIDDATGKRFHEATLKAGDVYAVPQAPKGLTIRTSRPQNIVLAVGGQDVPSLGAPDTLVKNIALDPAELAKRLAPSGTTPAATTPGQASGAGTPAASGAAPLSPNAATPAATPLATGADQAD